jgi:hypothetical protein
MRHLSFTVLLVGLVACGSDPAPHSDAGELPDAQVPDGGPGPDVLLPDAAPDAAPPVANLVLPEVIALPYVVAGAGGVSLTVDVSNPGGAPATAPGGGPLVWTLGGDEALTVTAAPVTVAAGGTATVTLAFAGAEVERIASATLSVTTSEASLSAPVHAVAGDPDLGDASFDLVPGAGGTDCGEGATVDMPRAPFPDGSATWDDPSVRVFLPEGYRDLPAQDVVVHFHGHSTTVAATLAGHRYQEHVCASGANVILVVPQGPVEAASGDFGKLMLPGGLEALVDEVLVLLFREGRIAHPVKSDVMLTSHSGGYRAVATILADDLPFPVTMVGLYDSLYGYADTYAAYALAGGWLRSSYTAGGGTDANNLALAADLEAAGATVATEPTQRALAAGAPVISFAAATHGGATRLDGIYGDAIRFAAGHSRRGPRIELRSAVASGGQATVTWLAPPDREATGFAVETSADGATWDPAAEVSADQGEATFPLVSGARVRVVARGPWPGPVRGSDVYRVDDGAAVLVVDGFDRVLDGSFGALAHDLAARVGEAAGPVHAASHRAVIEDGLDLAPYDVVIWLLGDESTADLVLSPAERDAIDAYLAGGGRILVSGSEAAWSLSSVDPTFLQVTLGAALQADDSGSLTVAGAGALSGLGPFAVAGPGAAYAEDYPDALTPVGEAETLLTYATGQAAAVGTPGRSVLVGFPLELLAGDGDLPVVMTALLDWLQE